jgi:cyclase
VAAVDVRYTKTGWEVYVKGGTVPTGLDALDWIKTCASRGAGEILLTSMDRDGTKSGYDLDLLKAVNNSVALPLIASGGAGTMEHCLEAFEIGSADAVLVASIFHFREIEISALKTYLSARGIPIRAV